MPCKHHLDKSNATINNAVISSSLKGTIIAINKPNLRIPLPCDMKKSKQSAGILLYRFKNEELEFFLVHPGGPFWAKKNEGAWSIPKGEFTTELPLEAAKREFAEETGITLPPGEFKPLTPVKLKSGKTVHAWAIEGNVNAETIKSNTLEIEWPPKSGKTITIPEVDKASWFTVDDATHHINTVQAAFITQTVGLLNTKE